MIEDTKKCGKCYRYKTLDKYSVRGRAGQLFKWCDECRAKAAAKQREEYRRKNVVVRNWECNTGCLFWVYCNAVKEWNVPLVCTAEPTERELENLKHLPPELLVLKPEIEVVRYEDRLDIHHVRAV